MSTKSNFVFIAIPNSIKLKQKDKKNFKVKISQKDIMKKKIKASKTGEKKNLKINLNLKKIKIYKNTLIFIDQKNEKYQVLYEI